MTYIATHCHAHGTLRTPILLPLVLVVLQNLARLFWTPQIGCPTGSLQQPEEVHRNRWQRAVPLIWHPLFPSTVVLGVLALPPSTAASLAVALLLGTSRPLLLRRVRFILQSKAEKMVPHCLWLGEA